MNTAGKTHLNDGEVHDDYHQPVHNDLAYVTSQARELIRKMQRRKESPPKETQRLLDKYRRTSETDEKAISISRSFI